MTMNFRQIVLALVLLLFCASGLYAQDVQNMKSEPAPATSDDLKKVTQAIRGLTRTQQTTIEELGKSLQKNSEATIQASKEAAEVASSKTSARAELLLNQRLREEAVQREDAERRSRNILLGSAIFAILAVLCIAIFAGYWTKRLIASLERRALAFSHMMLKRNDSHTKVLLSSETGKLMDDFGIVVRSATEVALRKALGATPMTSMERAIQDGAEKVFDTPIQQRIQLVDTPAKHAQMLLVLLDNPAWNKKWREDQTMELPVTITVTERTPGVKGDFHLKVHMRPLEKDSYAVFDGDNRKVALENTLKFAIGMAKDQASRVFAKQHAGHTVM